MSDIELLQTIAIATNGGARTDAIFGFLDAHDLDLSKLPSRKRGSLVRKIEFAANGMVTAAQRAVRIVEDAKSDLNKEISEHEKT